MSQSCDMISIVQVVFMLWGLIAP